MPITSPLRIAAEQMSESWELAVQSKDWDACSRLCGALGTGMELARRQLILADLDLQDACSSRL